MIAIKFLRQPSVSVLVALLFLLPRLSESCMSCLHPVSLPHNHNAHHHHSQAISIAVPHGTNPWGTGSRSNSIAVATTAARQLLEMCKKRCMNLHRSICTNPNYQRSLRLSTSAVLVAGGVITLARHHHLPSTVKQKLHRGLWRNELADGQDAEAIPDGDNLTGGDEATEEKEEPAMSSAMITTIGIYKNFISPLLPPACRFVPTCSQYGVQAIKEFGPGKGAILTSWRLLRCSPFGGKGYDPPKWPPVSYTYSSY